MVRTPCCPKREELNRGAWTAEEDTRLTQYVQTHGECGWRSLPKKAGLNRCGKSCRLRWLNYLRPDIKRGNIAPDEEELIIRMHRLLGNRWSLIAGRLPGRTDNEIKNYWNTHLSKKLAMSSQNPKFPMPAPADPEQTASSASSEEDVVRSADYRVIHHSGMRLAPAKIGGTSISAGVPAPVSSDEVINMKSWKQLLEDSLMSDFDDSEDDTSLMGIELSDDVLGSEAPLMEIQTNVSSSTSGPNEPVNSHGHLLADATSNQRSSESNVLYSQDSNVLSLPPTDNTLDFRIQDFSFESLLLPSVYNFDEICPVQSQINNIDHVSCFAVAAEQAMTDIYNNTLEPDWLTPVEYEKQSTQSDQMNLLGNFFLSEENWEEEVPTSLSKIQEEEYRDILVDISNK